MPTFDLKTHDTDRLTGKISLVNPYTLHIINATQYYERPIGSKNLWYLNGEPAGRLTGPTEVDAKAKHVEYKAPLSGTEKMAQELSAKDLELAAARAELAAIKAEKEATIKKAQESAKAAAPAAKTEAKA